MTNPVDEVARATRDELRKLEPDVRANELITEELIGLAQAARRAAVKELREFADEEDGIIQPFLNAYAKERGL